MTRKILALPGDGAGPDLISAAASVIAAATDDVEIAYGDIGLSAHNKTDRYLPQETLDLAAGSDAILAGIVSGRPQDPLYRDPLKTLKRQLNLSASIRKFYPLHEGIGHGDIDLIIITGNPDSLQNVIEKDSLDGVISEKIISIDMCRRLFALTMRMAEIKGRRSILCAHRSDLFPRSDRMFVDIFYKELAASEFIISDAEMDDTASRLATDPSSLDVIVSNEIYGSVLAGFAAGMVGGARLTPMGSIGDDVGMFEPMHRADDPDSLRNPTSAILSGAMALDHIGMPCVGEAVRDAVRSVYRQGTVTPDVGGASTAKEFTNAVIKTLEGNR